MDSNKQVQVLQMAYAGVLADAVLQFGSAGVLAGITARKRQENSLLAASCALLNLALRNRKKFFSS